MSAEFSKKKLFIETLGCAMNVRDSEHIIAELDDEYETTSKIDEADVILIPLPFPWFLVPWTPLVRKVQLMTDTSPPPVLWIPRS